MGTKNARKCNNDVRAYTPRLSTTGRRDTKANRARRQDRFRPVAPAWLGKRIRRRSATPKRVLFCIIFQSRKPDRARSVVQVHPGPPSKSPVNTRLFSLFPFSGDHPQKPFCQPFVNFTISQMPLHSRRSEAT